MTTADKRRVRKALDGLQYPAAQPAIISYAEERGADEKTRAALRALPGGVYRSITEVEDAVPQEPEKQDQAG